MEINKEINKYEAITNNNCSIKFIFLFDFFEKNINPSPIIREINNVVK